MLKKLLLITIQFSIFFFISSCSIIELDTTRDYQQVGEIKSFGEINFIWPIKGKVISSYGKEQGGVPAKGILIHSPQEDYVRAAKEGKISLICPDFKNYGKTIIISHDKSYYTVYANLSELFVNTGDTVLQGTAIAKADIDMKFKGSILYFEVRKDIETVNPIFFLP